MEVANQISDANKSKELISLVNNHNDLPPGVELGCE